MPVDAVDFSAPSISDFKLIDTSVGMAIRTMYPHVDEEVLAGLEIKTCLKVIHQLAGECSKSEYKFHNIRKKIKYTKFPDVKKLKRVAKNFKILLFKNSDGVTFYLYPRHFIEKPKDVEIFKGQRSGLKIDVIDPNDPSKSTFREVTETFSKVLTNTEAHNLFEEAFVKEVKHLRKFKGNKSVVTLYHYTQHPCHGAVQSYTKFRMFQERYKNNFSMYREYLTQDEKLDINFQTEKVFIYLTASLNRFHERKIFHGSVKLSSFLYKKSGRTKKVALSTLEYSAELHRKRKTVQCKGKLLLLCGYESIKGLLASNTFELPTEGLASDVWALGCTLYQFLTSSYPDFAQFASRAPKLNTLCYLLKNKTDRLSAAGNSRSSSKSSGSDNQSLSSLNPLFLSSIVSDWRSTSGEIHDPLNPVVEKQKPFRDMPFRLNDPLHKTVRRVIGIEREARENLLQINPKVLGNISEGSQRSLINGLEEQVEALCYEIQSHFLTESLDSSLDNSETIDLFHDTCEDILNFNREYLKILSEAEEVLREKREDQDPIMKLIKMMLHPDPLMRITTKKALAFLKKSFPSAYEKLHNNSK